MEHKNIKFPWWIQNSIPTAYDDSLSIYEVWCKLWYHYLNIIKYLNETLIIKVNEIIKDRNETIKVKINELIDSLSSYLTTVKAKINKEDELRLNNTNTMNTNINTITINNEIIKKCLMLSPIILNLYQLLYIMVLKTQLNLFLMMKIQTH